MAVLNRLTTAIFDLLFRPFEPLPPLLTLLVWSVVVGVLMAVVFRVVSNQRALGAAVDQARANLLAVKLFQHDLSVTLHCQFGLLRAIALRLWHSLPPMAVMVIPLALMLAQLGLRFEHYPLPSGKAAVIQLRLSPKAWQQHKDVRIQVPANAVVQTSPLRDDQEHAVYWRISSTGSEPFAVRWRLDDEVVEKQIAVADSSEKLIPVSVRRPGPFWLDQFLHPAESPLPSESAVQAVIVHHARRATPILGFDMPWWVTFLLVACASAWLVRPLIKVQF